jgi:hypothetical protein
MRFPKIPLDPGRHGPRGARPSPSILERVLPPDPKAPTRPTAPPPTCGTLPPRAPSLLRLLGGLRRPGR